MNKIFEVPAYAYERSPDQDSVNTVRHKVIVIGAGPIGLATAIDLAQQGVEVVVLDDNDKVSFGSRAICFSQRTLDIADRLGAVRPMVDKGVQWDKGKIYFHNRQIYEFDLQPDTGYAHPAFINLQQYYFEMALVERVRELQANGAPIEIRGRNKVEAIGTHDSHVTLEVVTPEGPYNIEAEWLIACDGASSPTRRMLGLDFEGQVFEDNFLIADVVMEADFPSERLFWFDPPFNRGQSALMQKQPDNVWRIDLQLGWDIDREREKRPENVIPRLKAMLGDDVDFELEWVSIYTFQCRRMERFRQGRVLFAGDSAHQVSPFGALGANSGMQDADNLCWKLKLVIEGKAPELLLDSYSLERAQAADENITKSSQSTSFITPKSEMSRLLRDAVLDLSARHQFARPLVNSGRLSTPCTYHRSSLNSADALNGPEFTRPGSACPDAPLGDEFLLPKLAGKFTLLTIDADAPDRIEEDGVEATRLALSVKDDVTLDLKRRYLGDATSAVYLIRPDQHVAARRDTYEENAFRQAIRRATGKE
ncbi:FAD-dependent oxidoreductase [Ruegeria profundi]|uniref:FAD-dependent oxidoreductase n=1 Tax=Ruegeria profundi TaxID=1685378 RepID=A0A0X3TVZ3_9RHOB|nr:FAD-dependent oxidoreductase [Ruegeria profundi]KUJ77520.1 FAD-dependent oxidoreductase [Ruegeria profundi]